MLRCIGIGGMGEVYEAIDRANDARVALKVLPAGHPESLLRFKNEFRALRDLEHPNLVSYGELLEERGHWFFTMELVDGVDFLAYVRPGEDEEDDEPSESNAEPTAPLSPLPSMVLRTLPRAVRKPARLIGFDEPRLRSAMGQLARGVAALHAIGKVHRDIKCANIRVTPEGRVVLVDFGLVADVEHPAYLTGGEEVVGTPLYMAPEQAARREVGPEADWYSVGVVLYRSLTRRYPFDGRTRDIMENKQDHDPVPPRSLIPHVPPDLDALCTELLRREPEARPRPAEILRRLGVVSPQESKRSSAPSSSPSAPRFIGRAPELVELRRLLEQTRSGRPVTVVLHGESGVGKTALLQSFTQHVAATLGAVTLSARCYESELVPFKAVDGIIDALSRYMITLPRSEAAALLPAKASLLTQIFPVLRGVKVIAESPAPLEEVRDPQELRSRAFSAVRELMARLAERRPLLLVLDDMQWTDADSLALLREIMRVPDPPALLLVLAMREGASDAATPIDASSLSGEIEHLHLARLLPGEAHELAARALEQLSVKDDTLARTIAEEAAGHPLFIDELARHAQVAGGHPGPLRLDEALDARLQTLGSEARDILELLAVAGTPLLKRTAARALDMEFGELSKRASLLRVAHLLRWSDTGHADSIEPYHDRIRAAVLARLPPERLRACHRRLALALEASQGDLEALAQHWRGAGENDKAATYALHAAAQAAGTLAFERAAQLYSLAIELGIADPNLSRQVHVRLGDALRNAGLGRDAAYAYLIAASGNASAAEKLELQRSAAEQLLLSGHFDDGVVALRTVLAAIGLEFPPTPWRALLSLVWNRVRLRLRGLGFRERDISQVSAEELTRCDVSWSASAGLSITDNVRGADFQCRNLLHALRLGEPHRIARALAIEAGHSSIDGGRNHRYSSRLFAASEELAIRLKDPYAMGLKKVASAMATLLAGKWRRAVELCDEGEAILRARCTGVSWELDSAVSFGMDSLWFFGALRELARRLPQRTAEALARGDLYGVITFRTGATNLLAVVHDDIATARRQLDESMARWSQRGVHLQHYRELYARMHIDLYERDGPAALARVLEAWPRFKRAQLFRVALVRFLVIELRARAAIASAAAQPERRRALLRQALRDARTLERSRMRWCVPAAKVVRAAAATILGDTAAAIARLREAIPGFEQADMPMHAATARRQLGRLLGGHEGDALVAAADAWLEGQDVRRPDHFARMLAPGFAD